MLLLHSALNIKIDQILHQTAQKLHCKFLGLMVIIMGVAAKCSEGWVDYSSS